MNSELFAQIFLNRIPYMTPRRFRALIEFAGSAEETLRLKSAELRAIGIADELAESWTTFFQDTQLARHAENEMARAERGEFSIVLESASEYPMLLRELSGRPPVLYTKGRWPMDSELTIAVVGTRHPTAYGLRVTEQLVGGLVAEGAVIVSGMAMGIDRTAHHTALQAGASTIGVLGHGFGSLYPRENAELYRKMAEDGTLLTEFPFEAGPSKLNFPRRNRIISGLSRGVVVIEAGEHSGALITARYAAEQGRDVFAVPGSIYELQAAGCHRLLREGAKLIQHAADILEDYVTRPLPRAETAPSVQTPVVCFDDLNTLESAVLQLVVDSSPTVDEMADRLKEPIDLLMNALLSLELKGRIRLQSGQRYAYNHQS